MKSRREKAEFDVFFKLLSRTVVLNYAVVITGCGIVNMIPYGRVIIPIVVGIDLMLLAGGGHFVKFVGIVVAFD